MLDIIQSHMINFDRLFNSKGPAGFIVKIDPQQTYFPKISSRVTKSGSMESNPLHLMTPDLEPAIFEKVGKYFPLVFFLLLIAHFFQNR